MDADGYFRGGWIWALRQRGQKIPISYIREETLTEFFFFINLVLSRRFQTNKGGG